VALNTITITLNIYPFIEIAIITVKPVYCDIQQEH
jgi:hypothetical protein